MLSKNYVLATAVCALLVSGCASNDLNAEGEKTNFVVAEVDNGKEIEYVPVPVPVAKPYFQKIPKMEMVKAKKVSPEKAIEDARKEALQISTPDGFVNATQVFDYMPGALYEIYASPGHLTSIMLEEGENLIDKASGNSKHWEMGESSMGSGKNSRTVLLLRAKKAGLSTNMVLTTNKRMYLLEAKSLPKGVYNASVQWYYPEDDFKNLTKKDHESDLMEEHIISGHVDLFDLDCDYSIEITKGSTPDWMPKEACDDGKKTYLRFEDNLGTTKAPVLYVMSDSGEAQIVSYHARGNFYVIHRPIKHAELRLGMKDQTIVRVTKKEKRGFFGRLVNSSQDENRYN